MDDLIKRHMEIKKDLERKKAQKAKLEGQLQSNLEYIKKNFGCDSIKDLSKKIDTEEERLRKMKADLPPLIEKMEKMLGGE